MDKKLLCATAISIAFLSSTAFAAGDGNSTKDFGEVATPNHTARTIPIKSDTSWVEVKDGETVNFAVNGQTFGWHFDGINTLSEIDLNKIAPDGALDHLVKVYINRRGDTDGA
jgi:hypothetical protein